MDGRNFQSLLFDNRVLNNGVWSYMNIDNNTVSVGCRGTTSHSKDSIGFIALCI